MTNMRRSKLWRFSSQISFYMKFIKLTIFLFEKVEYFKEKIGTLNETTNAFGQISLTIESNFLGTMLSVRFRFPSFDWILWVGWKFFNKSISLSFKFSAYFKISFVSKKQLTDFDYEMLK